LHIGPSRPIDPPDAIENIAAVLFTRLDFTGISPLPMRIASI